MNFVTLQEQIMVELCKQPRTELELAIELGSTVVKVREAITALQREDFVTVGKIVMLPCCARPQIQYAQVRKMRMAA